MKAPLLNEIGRSSVRGRAMIGIKLVLRTVTDNCRIVILHFGDRPISLIWAIPAELNVTLMKVYGNEKFWIRICTFFLIGKSQFLPELFYLKVIL